MKRLLFLFILIFIFSNFWFTGCSTTETARLPEKDITPELLMMAENYVSDGITHHKNGYDSLAVLSWKKALELIPGDAEVHNFLGIAYHKLNKLNSAEIQFSISTGLDPKYYQAFNNLGYVQFLNKKYTDAIQSFESALRIAPDYEPAKLNFQKTKAIMDGTLLREVFELTQKAEGIENAEGKVEIYKKILGMDSTFAEGHNNIAVAYYYADNLDSAYHHLNIALSLEKDYPEALNNLGYIYKVAGRYEEAIKLFMKAISLKKQYVFALNNLAETYQLVNEIQNAKRVFQTVLEIEPDNEYARSSIAKIDTTDAQPDK